LTISKDIEALQSKIGQKLNEAIQKEHQAINALREGFQDISSYLVHLKGTQPCQIFCNGTLTDTNGQLKKAKQEKRDACIAHK
jgi:hypothetical protein